jgi:hypothetical protein
MKNKQFEPTRLIPRLVLIHLKKILTFKIRDWELVKPCDAQLICALLEKQVKGAKNYHQKKPEKQKGNKILIQNGFGS